MKYLLKTHQFEENPEQSPFINQFPFGFEIEEIPALSSVELSPSINLDDLNLIQGISLIYWLKHPDSPLDNAIKAHSDELIIDILEVIKKLYSISIILSALHYNKCSIWDMSLNSPGLPLKLLSLECNEVRDRVERLLSRRTFGSPCLFEWFLKNPDDLENLLLNLKIDEFFSLLRIEKLNQFNFIEIAQKHPKSLELIVANIYYESDRLVFLLTNNACIWNACNPELKKSLLSYFTDDVKPHLEQGHPQCYHLNPKAFVNAFKNKKGFENLLKLIPAHDALNTFDLIKKLTGYDILANCIDHFYYCREIISYINLYSAETHNFLTRIFELELTYPAGFNPLNKLGCKNVFELHENVWKIRDAVINGNTRAIRALLVFGLDPNLLITIENVKSGPRMSLLTYAFLNDRLDIARLLVDAGGFQEVELAVSNLYNAACKNKTEWVVFYIEKMFKKHFENYVAKELTDTIKIALENSYSEMLRALLKCVDDINLVLSGLALNNEAFKKLFFNFFDFAAGTDLDLQLLKHNNVAGCCFIGISSFGQPITADMLKNQGIKGYERAIYTITQLDNLPPSRKEDILSCIQSVQKKLKNIGESGVVNLVSIETAVKHNCLDILSLRLGEIQSKDQLDPSLLVQAVKLGYSEITRLLLQTNKWSQVTINQAIDTAKKAGKNSIAQLIIETTDINMLLSDGLSSLHQAALSGDFREVQRLVQLKADVNLLSENKRTPLDYAICSMFDYTHYDINEPESPENLRRYQSYANILVYLLAVGADPNISGIILLSSSIKRVNYFALEILIPYIDLKVSCESKKKLEYSKLMFGVFDSPLKRKPEYNYESIRVLLDNGADINHKNENDCTLLDIAIQKRNLGLCDFLIKNGALVSSLNQRTLELASQEIKDFLTRANEQPKSSVSSTQLTHLGLFRQNRQNHPLKICQNDINELTDSNVGIMQLIGNKIFGI